MSSGTAPLRPGAFPEKEIDVIGSSCATAEDFAQAIRLVAANRAALAAVFSHHFPLARAAEAFEFAMKQAAGRYQDRRDRELRNRNSPP